MPSENSAKSPTIPYSSATGASSGEALFLANLPVIDSAIRFVCRRQHLNASDAEEFASHARLELMLDNYAVLRKFAGRSSLKTFLSVTIQRIFFDYRIAAWGKWRPSAEARRRGPVAILLEQLTVRDSYTFDEAFELITTNHGVAISRQELENLAGCLPARVKRRLESDEALANVPSSAAADQELAEAERSRALARVADALQREIAALSPQDRLIVTLRFHDGHTVANMGTMLRLEPKLLYRRLERLLRDLRARLKSGGVDAALVAELLAGEAFEMREEEAGPKAVSQRPSNTRGDGP